MLLGSKLIVYPFFFIVSNNSFNQLHKLFHV